MSQILHLRKQSWQCTLPPASIQQRRKIHNSFSMLQATEAKADMILVKKEWLQAALAPNSRSPIPAHREGRPIESFMEELKYATSGND